MSDTRASGDASGVSLDEMEQYILRERARSLAAVADGGQGAVAGEVWEVLQFTVGGTRFGVSTRFVREVEALGEVTPIPCTPDSILGVVGVRGLIVAVTDPVFFFGLGRGPGHAPGSLVVLSDGAMTTAFAVDSVLGVCVVAVADLQRDMSGMPPGLAPYVLGMTGEPMLLLDAGRLLADRKLVVHEEVD